MASKDGTINRLGAGLAIVEKQQGGTLSYYKDLKPGDLEMPQQPAD